MEELNKQAHGTVGKELDVEAKVGSTIMLVFSKVEGEVAIKMMLEVIGEIWDIVSGGEHFIDVLVFFEKDSDLVKEIVN